MTSAQPLGSYRAALILALGFWGSAALAQTNPVPLINQPLVPDASAPGGPTFTLTVNGTGFVAASVVNWNGSARATTFGSNSQLTAAILASDIATAGTASVTVVNPSPGGGTSNPDLFEITSPTGFLSLSRSDLPTGTTPTSVIADDFNHDGKLDLAVCDANSNAVSILLGNGDGTFQQHVDYATGASPQAVIAGDFNLDGNLDLALVNHADNTVSVLLGNGDGSFRAHVDFAVGQNPLALATGDFNGDGKLDLAVCDVSSNVVSILLGNGDGTFQPQVEYATSGSPDSVAIGDFNRDGKLDLAVVDQAGSAVSILLGNGDGSFQSRVDYATDQIPISVAVADLNNDGKLDLVIGHFAGSNVSILLGNGDGTFQPQIDYATGPLPFSVITGDFNGDGKLDLATANISDNTASILLGNGDGTFQANVDFAVGSDPAGSAVGDFNDDGRLDLVVSNEGSNTVSVLLQTPAVTLSNTSLAFGAQNIGTTSTPQTALLTNTGSAPLSISTISITGANPGDFAETNNCGASVAAGATCSINVTFTPIAAGVRTGMVTIADNALGSPQTVSLSGTGLQPAVTLSPTSLTFPTQVVFTSSKAQTVMLTNSGNGALSITSIAVTGKFSQTNTCGASVAAGASCTISVTFRPTTKGTQTGTLSITDNAPESPQNVPLTGTGTYIQLSPTSLNFGSQPVGTTSLKKKIALTNKGSVTVSVTSITITGTNAGDFGQTNTCGSSLAAGASCFITVTFTPKAKGKRTAAASVADNGGGSPQKVTLTGTGT